MHYVRLIFNACNYLGYCFWSISVLNFFEQILNDNFSFKNINSFLSACAAFVALIFAVFKLIAYIRDSKIKSKILEEELIEKHNKNRFNSGHIDFYDKFNNDFNR